MTPQPPAPHAPFHVPFSGPPQSKASACDDSWPPPLVRKDCSSVRREQPTAAQVSVGCAGLAGEKPQRNEGDDAREHAL
jgi:hypothetical protein